MSGIKASLIIPAAGMGRRMGASKNKTLLLLDSKTILEHTLELFASISEIVQVVLVCRREEMADMARLLKSLSASWQWDIVEGGAQRYLSVRNGVQAVIDDVDVIAIHDAVRPFVSKDIVLKALQVALRDGASLVGHFAQDTIKMVSDSGTVVHTPDRSKVFHAQTPQIFKRDICKACNEGLSENETYTDDCSLAEAKGYPITIVEGNSDNIKITTPQDLLIAKAILANRLKSI